MCNTTSSCTRTLKDKIFGIKKHKENVVRPRPDCFLCLDQQIIRRYAICDSRQFVANHKLVCGTLISNILKENKSYLNGRTRFPHWTPKMGPSLKMDSICHDIEKVALPPVPKLEQRHKRWITDTSWNCRLAEFIAQASWANQYYWIPPSHLQFEHLPQGQLKTTSSYYRGINRGWP